MISYLFINIILIDLSASLISLLTKLVIEIEFLPCYYIGILCIVASQVGKFLKTSGILKYVEETWTTLKLYWSAGHKAIKDSSPEYYKAVVDLCAPYVKLTGDICLTIRNISIKLYNNAAVYVERNIPIILDTVSNENLKYFYTTLRIKYFFQQFFFFYTDRALRSRHPGAN